MTRGKKPGLLVRVHLSKTDNQQEEGEETKTGRGGYERGLPTETGPTTIFWEVQLPRGPSDPGSLGDNQARTNQGLALEQSERPATGLPRL